MPRGPRLIAGEGAINSRVRGAASSQKVKKVKASTEFQLTIRAFIFSYSYLGAF